MYILDLKQPNKIKLINPFLCNFQSGQNPQNSYSQHFKISCLYTILYNRVLRTIERKSTLIIYIILYENVFREKHLYSISCDSNH